MPKAQRTPKPLQWGLTLLSIGLVSSCTSLSDQQYDVKPSILEGETAAQELQVISAADNGNDAARLKPGFSELPSLHDAIDDEEQVDLSKQFSTDTQLRFAVDEMQTREFIHYVFGELLGVNYSISKTIEEDADSLTLNVQKSLNQVEVFELAESELSRAGITIAEKNGIFYFHRPEGMKEGLRIGVGRQMSDIPSVKTDILQIIPVNFGISTSLERTLRDITEATITPDVEQGTIYVQGSYGAIQRAMEMINLLDQPVNRGKYVGLMRLKYMTPEAFVNDLTPLLEGEGIPAGTPSSTEAQSVVLVPMQQRGYVAIFSSRKQFMERVEFWANELDNPPQGTEKRYFIYAPKFARAADLGDSLQPLITGQSSTASGSSGNSARDTRSAVGSDTTSNSGGNAGTVTANSENLRMVVDQRSNLLIFYTTGREYELLLPLIERLDVVPRQIILEATIAEVTLNDEFRFGVEWALERGDWSASTNGAFGVEDLGGLALNYAANADIATAQAFQNNSLVNVLSNPTLLVRDGTSANITVGTEIPIVTSTISDPFEGTGAVQQNVARRQIGLKFDVTPTINSQGVVIMQIDQSITNETSTGAGGGNNPTLFNRSISTEVVANSGQTIILGGLISENASDGIDGVPGLSEIPILGNLFKSKTKSKSKTELVIMVTPRIIDNQRQWDSIKNDFAAGLKNVNLVN